MLPPPAHRRRRVVPRLPPIESSVEIILRVDFVIQSFSLLQFKKYID
jgi:hypothetical protein